VKTPKPAQWEAIRAVDRHVLVAAGAGTGKTTTVVGRILYLLGVPFEEGRYPAPVTLDRIAAITYTNAAAADLKRKLREELREAGLRDVAYEVDNARIGTIHGFCGDILRESALRSGRSPGFEVLEEGEGGALLAEAVRDALVAAVSEDATPGLRELLSVHRQRDVEEFVRRLAEDADRLARMRRDATLPLEEGALVRLAVRAREELERRLDEQGAVDFDRMISWTRDLLRDDAAVRRRLQRRMHTLIVDEFQDVDPLQKEIAWLLGDPEGGDPSSTRLMLVGDPKQSIYRFRRADVTVWRSVERAFRDGGLGEVVALQENFRSVAPILGFVDAAIGPVLDAPVDGEALQDFEVGYQPVTAMPSTEGPADGAVELLLVPSDEKGKLLTAKPRRQAEAEALARRARELFESGVPYRGMAALFASVKGVEVYQQALERQGVPTYLLRGEGFYERREVLDLVLALRTIRDPDDNQALLGFLRSPFVALRDDTLLQLAWGGEGSCWARLRTGELAEPDRVALAVALIEEHAALRDRVPIHDLLTSLLDRSGYLAQLALRGEEAGQALANVRKFLRLARQHEGAAVGDFLRMIAEMRERKEREGDERLHGQTDDVMTLTTVHSAKGLEWDVVFWCDLERKPPNAGGRDSTLLIGREGIALKDPDVEKTDDQPQAWRDILAAEGEESAAERKRLWYVAATRARQRLILGGVSAEGHEKGGPAAAIAEHLTFTATDGSAFSYLSREGKQFSGTIRLATLVEERPEVEVDTWAEPLPGEVPAQVAVLDSPAGPARHSATSLMTHARCPRRHWLRYVAGLKEPEVPRSGGDYLSALARGQVIHEVLEQLEEEADVDALLDAAIGRWDDSAPPPDSEPGQELRERLREELKLVSNHSDYRKLAEHPTARRELGFLQLLGPDQRIEGKIDLAAREPEGIVLLDVKTAQKGKEEVAEIASGYGLQRAVYVQAAEAIGGEPVARFAFQFSRAETQVSTPVTDALRAEGRKQVQEALGAIADGEADLTTFPKECRYCGFKAAGWCPGAEGGS